MDLVSAKLKSFIIYFSCSCVYPLVCDAELRPETLNADYISEAEAPGSQPHPTSNYVKWFLHHNSDVILVWAVVHRRVLGETCWALVNSAQLCPLRRGLECLMWEGNGKKLMKYGSNSFLPPVMSNLLICWVDVPLNLQSCLPAQKRVNER